MNLRSAVEIRRSRIHRRGLFAVRRFARGETIVEYTGERISHQEAYDRYAHSPSTRRRTYLFTLDRSSVIDATKSTSVARFINHSCLPNSRSVVEGKRIFIEAMRTILPGTEITYDYHLEVERDSQRILKRLYECHCGSKACRGTICQRPKKRRLRANPDH